jgi:16S rRNA (cytosine967-C5)-methyltransferase
MRLTFGTIQRRATLDHLIEELAERRPERLDSAVRAALQLGLYELLFLGGAPDHAVVSDAVELAKGPTGRRRGASRGHALVNAVLRRAVREGRGRLEALDDGDPQAAAIAHSHPEWVAEMWWELLGPGRARQLMIANNEPAELALRVNSLRAEAATVKSELGVPARLDAELPEALVLEGAFAAHESSAWREGRILAQSRAAMLVSHALAPLAGERVLDLCAAPGGKTTHLAALMGGSGEVVAVERNRSRAGILAQTAKRLGAENVVVEVADARRPRASGEPFDRVLVDPPCSGLGTLQGHPDLRWRMTPERVQEMVADQVALLESGAQALRPGGVLVYSTCTISPPENERLIEGFLASHPEFRLRDLGATWPALRMDRALVKAHRSELTGKALLTLPSRDRTAGFFIASLCRGGLQSQSSAGAGA